MSIGPYILLLPDIALEKIFSFLSFDEIARNREVCRKFNDVGSKVLSRGFVQIERRHASVYKRVKSLLPRRESERRLHPLFRHCDILSAVETRISMLNITYMKYIQNGLCCFIPGKVLDELVKVLNIVEQAGAPPRANEILQELRDISSMAIEYFDEKISPRMRGQASQAGQSSSFSPTVSPCKPPKVYFVQPAMQEEIRKLSKVNNRQRAHINCLSKEVQKLYMRVQKQQNRIKSQAATIQENTTKLQEQENKSLQQDNAIAELKKQVGDWEQKLAALTTEVVTSRDEIVRAIFPMPAEVSQCGGAPQQPKTIIRPRVSQVQTPNTYIVELERKRKASMDADIPNKLRFIMAHEPGAYSLKEQATNKINETITRNIAQNIRDEVEDTSRKKYDLNTLLSSSMDSLIRSSIGIKPAKRRYTNEADVLVNLH